MTVWTEERSALLRTLWDGGMSAATIGRQIGASKNAVVGRVHRMGLTPRPSPIPGRDLTAPKVPRAPKSISAPPINVATLPPLMSEVSVLFGIAPPAPAVVVPMVHTAPAHPHRTRQCEWLTGDRPRDFVRCDHPTIGGGSWCRAHHSVVFVRRRAEAA
jgi:GcrA cell cycle regulator